MNTPLTPFKKFTAHAKHVFAQAVMYAQNERAEAVTPLHCARALTREKGSLAHNILKINAIRLAPAPRVKAPAIKTIPPFDATLKAVTKKAAATAAFHGHKHIGTEHILLAMLLCSDVFSQHKKYARVLSQLEHILESTAQLQNFKPVPKETVSAHASPRPSPKQKKTKRDTGNAVKELDAFFSEKRSTEKKFPALSFFCEDLVLKAREHTDSAFFGREKEMERVISSLLRKTKNNPLLIGEAGVGKTAIVRGLAAKIAAGAVPPDLARKKIFALDMGLLVAGTTFRGEFEARLKDVIEEAKDTEVILFIDEIHTIVGAGSAAGALDAANILKPALAEGAIKVIAATTPDEYRRSIEKDPALARRFQPIAVREESEDAIFSLIERAKISYEAHHHVIIGSDAVRAAIAYSQKYQPNKRLPDKALDLIDETASRLRTHYPSSAKTEIVSFETELKALQAKKDNAIYGAQYDTALKMHSDERAFAERWRTDHPHGVALDAPIVIEPRHVRETIADILGIDILDTEASAPDIASELARTVIGQAEAVNAISSVVTRARAGLISPHRPIGSFLFLGPSGVGKTHTAKMLANALFGTRAAHQHALTNFIRIDMSEFSEPHSISRLIGSPPGYVGHEDGGYLTEKVKRNPYSLILFDEIEKAHPQIFNIFLQILDEGMLTSATSEHVSFKNTVIVMTSNIGTEEFNKQAMGFSEQEKDPTQVKTAYEAIKKNVLAALKEVLRPELINRIDSILTFMPLDADALRAVARKHIDALAEKLKAEKSITLSTDQKVIDFIAAKSKNPAEGARLITRTIAEHIEFPIAARITSHTEKPCTRIKLTVKKNVIAIEAK